MEGGPQRHGVDRQPPAASRQPPVVGEFENDHFEQVACSVGADHEQLRRVVMLVHVDDNDRVVDDVLNRGVIDAMATS